ncbi:MAG: hypothetical protein RSD08_09750 [Oscillospiraceae bacterium]
MNDETMNEAMAEFINRRINWQGSHESQLMQDALAVFIESANMLEKTLDDKQKKLFRMCEDAYASVEGEAMNSYYRAGFSDAVTFVLGWRDGTWN